MKKVHIFGSILLIMGLLIFQTVRSVTAEPGAADDPLVSQSYVDAKINELNLRIADQNNQINTLKQQLGSVQYPKFEILEGVEPGKTIIGGASTEFILRVGEVTTIIGPNSNGGIFNLNSGVEIRESGVSVPLNQLLFISRDDGRGFKTVKQSWIMVKGPYTIK